MAKLSDLVPVMAEVLGRSEATVAVYARHLRAARLISTAGRGAGGADMTEEDCVTLLEAVIGSSQAKDAPDFIDKLKNTYFCRHYDAKIDDNGNLEFTWNEEGRGKVSFHEDMVFVLKSVRKGNFGAVSFSRFDRAEINGGDVSIRARIREPGLQAHISVKKSIWRDGKFIEEVNLFDGRYINFGDPLLKKVMLRKEADRTGYKYDNYEFSSPDLMTQAAVGTDTFCRLARLLGLS